MAKTVFSFLWKYVKKLKFLFFILFTSIVISEFVYRLSFYYISKVVDLFSSNLERADIFKQAVFLVILASVLSLVRALLLNSFIFIEARAVPTLRSIISKDLFEYAHKHSTAFFDEEMAGNVSGKIRTMVDSSISMYYLSSWGVLQFLASFVWTFVFMFKIDSGMALIMLVLMSISVIFLYYLTNTLTPYAKKTAKALSESNGVLVDSITNASLVKSFGRFGFERRNFFKSLRKAAKVDKEETMKYAWVNLSQNVLKSVLEIVFFIIPIIYWYHGKISIGDFVMVQTLIFTVSASYNRIMMLFSDTARRIGQIQDGIELLSKPYDITNSSNAKLLSTTAGDVVFENVLYHYKTSKPLFENFNLRITQGEKVGIVGESGAGKSTLVKILSRYYDVQKGEIKIGSQNIKDVTLKSLRETISLIPQDPSLFNRTIMENIRYGNLGASDEEVFEAARKAYCHDFISALQQGYQSKVGDRGVMLSGGERQRVAIARAILKNSPILILDEATSALDSESEKYIQESLKVLMEGKTVIAIAHRLSTLREMDRIVVLDKGSIIEEGSHQSLLRKKGVYHNFYDMQSAGFINLG